MVNTGERKGCETVSNRLQIVEGGASEPVGLVEVARRKELRGRWR